MRSTTRKRLEDCDLASTGQIRFCVPAQDGRLFWVFGRVVDVAPHLSATFAVHGAADGSGWCVTDIDSGGRASFSKRSAADAVSLAAADLSLRTDADMRRARERVRGLIKQRAGEGG